ERFAGICGLHRTYMGHVERGERNICLSTVVRIAQGLQISLVVLFSGVEKPLGNGDIAAAYPVKNRKSDGSGAGITLDRMFRELQRELSALKKLVMVLGKQPVTLKVRGRASGQKHRPR